MNGGSRNVDEPAEASISSETDPEGNETANTSTLEDEEGEVVVSMVDVLEEEEALQESAAAVLGGSDDQNCTYTEGYIGRQALYSCLTCAKAAHNSSTAGSRLNAGAFGTAVSAGVCLACSHECHDGHDLVELYTKRNFRCDCGNSKFSGSPCKLCPTKEAINAANKYNQNFVGLYCTCSRPYPDPEDQTDDVMLQCIACEDWFHLRHVCEFKLDTEDWDELICGSCMQQYTFLQLYARLCRGAFDPRNKQLCEGGAMSEAETKSDVDVVGVADDLSVIVLPAGTEQSQASTSFTANQSGASMQTADQSQASTSSVDQLGASMQPASQFVTVAPGGSQSEAAVSTVSQSDGRFAELMQASDQSTTTENKQLSKESEIASHSVENICEHEGKAGCSQATSDCKLDKLSYIKIDFNCIGKSNQTGSNWIGSVFWKESWRSALCRCSRCLEMYSALGVEYLLDDGDSIQAYEKRGKERLKRSTYEQGMEALSGLDRVQQIELLTGYADMKAELQEYLKKFIDNHKVVRSEDISEFFTQLEARKRRRLDDQPSQNYAL